jgi:hypothetical protein
MIERVILESEVRANPPTSPPSLYTKTWSVSNLIASELRNNFGPGPVIRDPSITYRLVQDVSTFQYYPCVGSRMRKLPTMVLADLNYNNVFSSGNISLPDTGIHTFIPVHETTCRPRLVRYDVVVAHMSGTQKVSYSTKEELSMPHYDGTFQAFNGSFELFVQLSDAMTIYNDFASNLNNSRTIFQHRTFKDPNYPEPTKPHTLDNGSIVETCLLEIVEKDSMYWPMTLDLWPLSVFERRLGRPEGSYTQVFFDKEMAMELLINTTISALSMNERFHVVNGTESRNFNIYHFQNRLVFFLPYGLSLGFAIPIIAMGLFALYIRNYGVSAISGGFVQLLMTTTGHTAIDSVMARGFATLGGYENVSKELQNMEIRFGELVHGDKDSYDKLTMTELQADRLSGTAEGQEVVEERSEVRVELGGTSAVRRAGFGTEQDVRPLRNEGRKRV